MRGGSEEQFFELLVRWFREAGELADVSVMRPRPTADYGYDVALVQRLPDGRERVVVVEAKEYRDFLFGVGLVGPATATGTGSTEVDQAGTRHWQAEAWRARALLLASLYFAFTVSAEIVIPNELLTKLEAHLVAALGIWFYFAERNRRKDD